MAIDLIPKRLYEKMGISIALIVSEGPPRYFKVFLQPLRYKNKIYLRGVPTELGYDSMKKYLVIAPPDAPLDIIDGNTYELEFEGDRFSVDHCEKVYHKEKPLYFWAIVSREA